MFGGIPFEHFAHGGGGSFGGGGMGGPSEPVDTTKLYETLEVEKDATPAQIKKVEMEGLNRTFTVEKNKEVLRHFEAKLFQKERQDQPKIKVPYKKTCIG